MKTLTITRPDDWHLHVRNGAILKTVLPHTARQFARAIIMPNLKPPVTTVAQALAYREAILQAVPAGVDFTPLMTLYLTSSTTIAEIKTAAKSDHIYAFKLYPAGATTNSDSGVTDIKAIFPLLAEMEKQDIPLLIHGEVTDEHCDIFDRERVFVDTSLTDIVDNFPGLRIVVEHVTTTEAVQFVEATGSNIAATMAGGIHPHYYCLPIIKREHHRLTLVTAATSGNPKFFLGTDSAPHTTSLKETSCGCAGCYSAHAALELYTEAFDRAGSLDKLEGFASFYGADFYRLPRNSGTVTLEKTTWRVPASYGENDTLITPLKSGEELSWKMQ